MTTVDVLLAGLTMALLICLAVFVSLTIVRSRELARRDAEKQAETAEPPYSAGPAMREPHGAAPRQSAARQFVERETQRRAHQGYWERYAESLEKAAEPPTYRVRPVGEGAPKWNPYAEEQSRAHRARARRGQRSYRRVGAAEDHYALLGVERGASDEAIEQAYRRHAARIHPDKFFDDPFRRAEAEKKLKQLNAVMQILRDPGRRAQYDARLDRRDRETGPRGGE